MNLFTSLFELKPLHLTGDFPAVFQSVFLHQCGHVQLPGAVWERAGSVPLPQREEPQSQPGPLGGLGLPAGLQECGPQLHGQAVLCGGPSVHPT